MSAYNKLRLLVTEACQLDCYYCHQEARRGDDTDSQLGYEGFRIVLQAGRLLSFDHVRLSGGEPLLCFDLTLALIEAALRKGYADVGVTTNGILLPRYWPRLQEWATSGRLRIGVTLNAVNGEMYQGIARRPFDTLQKTLDGIRLLAGLRGCKIITVVGQRNLADLAEILRVGAEFSLLNKLVDMVDAPAGEYVSITTIEQSLQELGYQPAEMRGDYQFFENGQSHQVQVPHRSYYPRCQACPLHPCMEGDLAIRVYSGGMVRPCFGAPPLYLKSLDVPAVALVLARAREWSRDGYEALSRPLSTSGLGSAYVV
jgi:molybdenum cofactor biosynthesis enzyme MoaA